jgi:TatD DNase family protein
LKSNPLTFIDIHTHKHNAEVGLISIQNLLADFDQIPEEGWYSIGLHPWHLQPDQAQALPDSLLRAAAARNVLAIGECGLDTVCDTPMALQRAVFILQIALANEIRKPLIIHCVRAFDEVLTILRKHRVSVPVIFHGFRKADRLAAKILDAGHYLSFGRHLLTPSVAEVFRKLPVDRVFLETDDTDIPIADIYEAAATIRGEDIPKMSNDICMLFKLIFGPVTDQI